MVFMKYQESLKVLVKSLWETQGIHHQTATETRLFNIALRLFSCSAGISNAEARQPGKAPNFSVNWTVGDQGLEVINATTGKDDLGRPSRLCKHALYSRWMRLHNKVTHVRRFFFFCADTALD